LLEDVFAGVYARARWGMNGGDAGTSGYGSTLAATQIYRTFLQRFLRDADVHSVVDAGCGDWEFSQALDWKGIDYKGYDIVPAVIEHDKARYGRPNIQFFVANVVDADLPPADLLIVKHVLQHLPDADVLKFLTQLPKYKHVLLVDSVSAATLSAKNRDVPAGGFRELDVTKPPFAVKGAKLLTYWDGGNMQQVVYVSRSQAD
jgi:SAM-dependent methyltransferase